MSTEVQVYNSNQQARSLFFDIASFESGQRMATLLASSKLIPTTFQNNLPDCLIALELAMRIGVSPMAVMQNTFIIHGRPGYSAQFVIAMINSCGKYSPLRFELEGEGDTRSCYAWAYESATGEKLSGTTVSMAMAKAEGWVGKNGSKWQTMPELMLRYRAATFFGRMYAPELLMGMRTAEELHDEPVTKNAEQQAVPLSDLNARFSAPAKPEVIEAEVVEVQPTEQAEVVKKERKSKKAPDSPPLNEKQEGKADTQPEQKNQTTSNPEAKKQETPVPAQPEISVEAVKAEIAGIEKWTDLFRWPDANSGLISGLAKDQQNEILSYCNAMLHVRQVEEKVTVEGVNQFADMKLKGLKIQLEQTHAATAPALFEMVQKRAIDKIAEIRGDVKETPPSKLSGEYLKFQEQLYTKETSLTLDQWALATHQTREKQLSPDEHIALMDEISERRVEIQKLEKEKQQ